MADMDELKRRAHEWVDRLNSGTGLEGSWRLQRIERRTKTAPGSGEPAGDLPVRIRRFAKGIPANLIDEAIQYLVKELSPYTGIVFNGTILEGRYVPTRTWWERDEQAVVDRGQARENTYTLYQDLSDADRFDEAVFSAGGSCSEEIEMRYEYERFSVESVPAGGKGVTYSVQAVSRNDDGTFDYAVVKRVAVTKHSEPAVVKCDDFEKVTVETWDNLYGEPDAWLDNSGVEDKTDPGSFSPVDLPMPCETEDGTLVEVTIRKNDDWTYSAVVQTTESKSVEPAQKSKQKSLRGVTETVVSRNVTDDTIPEVLELGERFEIERNPDGTVNRTHTFVSLEAVGDTGSTCQKTLFEHEHSDMTNVPDRPTAEVDAASGGVVHERTARATEEGTWDVVERTTTEQKVEGAQKSKQKTLRGVTVTTVDRNTEDGTIPDASAMGLGERVQVERTPGGLYNRTVTEVSPEAVGDTGSTCQKTLFEHEHSDMTNVPDRPTAEVDPASGGVVHERTARATEEGTWDVVERTTTEQKVEGAQKSKQKTLRGVTVTTVDRNTEDGTIPDASAMGLGERVQVERTPGGLYNRTVTEVSPEAVGDTGSTCQKTLFEHEHSDMTNVPDRPTAEVDAASGGVVHERTARATEEGTWDVVERTTTEQKVEGAQKSKQKTLRGVTVTTVDRNTEDGTIPDASAMGLGERVQVERTPGGLYNRTVTEVLPEAVGDTGSTCQKTLFEHEHSDMTNVPDRPTAEVAPASGGVVHERTARATEEGTWDVVERTTKEQKVKGAQKSKQKTLRGVTVTTVDRNMPTGDIPETLELGERYQVERTPGGLYNVTHTEVSPEAVGDTGSTCQKTLFEHEHSVMTNVSDRPIAEVDAASGGVVHERTVRATEEGTWDVIEKTTTEIRKLDAQRTIHKTLRGVIETSVGRNLDESEIPVFDSSMDLHFGERYQIDATPGGLYNLSHTVVTGEDAGEISSDCRRNVFEHTHSTTVNQVDEPEDTDKEAHDPGNGFVYERSIRVTEEGTYDVTDRVSEELETPSSTEVLKKTLHGIIKTITDQNVSAKEMPSSSSLAVGETVEFTQNPGGTFNKTRTTVDETPVGYTAGDHRPSVFFDRTSVTENVTKLTEEDSIGSFTCGGGPLVSKTVRETEYGTWDRTVDTVTPVARSWTDPDVDTNFLYRRTYRFKNFIKSDVTSLAADVNKYAMSKMKAWVTAGRTPSSQSVSTQSDLTDTGCFDGSVVMEFRWDMSTSGQYGSLGGDADHTLKGGITSKFLWKTFSISDRYINTTQGGFSPAFDYGHPKNWFFTTVQTHMRLVGFGKEILDSLLKYTYGNQEKLYVFNGVSFDYDEVTTAWRFECILKVEEPSTPSFEAIPTDYTLYARDVNKNYGFPVEYKSTGGSSMGYLRDGEITDDLNSFIKNHVDPYVINPGDRVACQATEEPQEPRPGYLYPDSCSEGTEEGV